MNNMIVMSIFGIYELYGNFLYLDAKIKNYSVKNLLLPTEYHFTHSKKRIGPDQGEIDDMPG
jgi:hypothetical protein